MIDTHVTHLRAALVENHVLVPALLRALSFVLHENSPRYLTKVLIALFGKRLTANCRYRSC